MILTSVSRLRLFFMFKAIYAKRVYLVLDIYFNDCFGIIKVNTYAVAYCKTGYKNRQHKIHVILEKFPVFRFSLKNPELNRKWIRFKNRRDWTPTRHSSVCFYILKKSF